jgi:hypothetical protein
MPPTPASNVAGLHKHHSRACLNKRGKPTNCAAVVCPLSVTPEGSAEWSGQQVDPRKLRPRRSNLNRFKSAIDKRNTARTVRAVLDPTAVQRVCKEWQTHCAEARRPPPIALTDARRARVGGERP